jgi:hypothetical protein
MRVEARACMEALGFRQELNCGVSSDLVTPRDQVAGPNTNALRIHFLPIDRKLHRSIAGLFNNRSQMIRDAFELIRLTKKPAAGRHILRLGLCVTRNDD